MPYSGSGGLADKPAQERTRVPTIPATKLTGPVRGRQKLPSTTRLRTVPPSCKPPAAHPGLQQIGRTVAKFLNNATELDRNGINELCVAYMSRKTNRLIGYARVSTAGQDLSRQVRALKAERCTRIFTDTASGKSLEGRPELARAIADLAPADVLVLARHGAAVGHRHGAERATLKGHRAGSGKKTASTGLRTEPLTLATTAEAIPSDISINFLGG